MSNYFSSNLKKIREARGLSQSKLGAMAGVNQTTIARWENKEIAPSIDNVEDLANALNISLPDLLTKNLSFDNASFIELDDVIKIPIFGTIKAGIPIESQSDIIDFVEIPRAWLRGGRKFFALIISGDSMFPKYQENDIVIFEQTNDASLYNGKDAAVMINGTESTFKKVLVNEQGIVLQPYNTAYDIMMFSKEKVETLPIKVVGVAVEKRTKI